MLTFDLTPGRFDERRVLHAGRTRGHARHAAEAGVEVTDEAVGHFGAPFESGLHEVNPPARRVHLFAPQHVRRAGRETETAVHALVDPVSQRGRLRAVDASASLEAFSRSVAHSGPRPAFNVFCGSSARFSDARSGSRSPIDPQTSTAALSASDPRRTTVFPNVADWRRRVMTRACVPVSPSIRNRPAPTAALPTTSISAPIVFSSAIAGVMAAGSQLARTIAPEADQTRALWSRPSVSSPPPSITSMPDTNEPSSARAWPTCASTTAGSDAKRRRNAELCVDRTSSSKASGSSWLAIICCTTWPTRTSWSIVTTSVFEAFGSGDSLNVALVIAARLPNDPVTSLPRS